MFSNITEIEIPYLPKDFNLTDGHAYRSWAADELQIIDNVSLFIKTTNRQMQHELEKEYIKDFLKLGKQTADFHSNKYLLCSNASMGLEIIANFLRLHHMSLALSEPCFDNLADIYRRHDVVLHPFPDLYYSKPTDEFMSYLSSYSVDAFCFVTPNNPTGNHLTQENFIALIKFCKENNKFLILDFCFRFYLPEDLIYDQYSLLRDSGIDYIVVEDTGKTWPTVELKAPFITVPVNIYDEIYKIYTDMILHISPFTLRLVDEFVKLSMKDNLQQVHSVVAKNRGVLYKNLQGTFVSPVERPYASVAWLSLHTMTGWQFKELLEKYNIHVLPGDYFYWSNHDKGKKFVRVALVRDTDVFEKAANLIGEICKNESPEENTIENLLA